jgi:hypothetical protein
LLLAGSLFAQRHVPGGYGSGTGFGNVIYPGTGRPPVNPRGAGTGSVIFPGGTPRPSPLSVTDPTFPRRVANTVSGRVPYGYGAPNGYGKRGGGRGQSYVYAYPVFLGGLDAYWPQQPQEPNVTVVYPPPQPPVIINQSFQPAQPMVQEIAPGEIRETSGISIYQAPTRSAEEVEAAGSAAPPAYYLIAFKDHSVYSVVAYWVDGDTLHYFTSGNTHNQVSMSLVDKELTERLNQQRKVGVQLK